MRVVLALLLLVLQTATVVAQISPQAERASRQAARQIEARWRVIDDPVRIDRVGTIIERLRPLVDGEGRTWRFRIIDNPTPNAFVLPSGDIYVHVGLFDALPGNGPLTDDELAFVLAHEMMHVAMNHAARANGATNGLERLIRRSGVVRSPAASILTRVLSSGVEASYSREMETEADREALVCVAQAGYRPEAALTLFDRMRQYQQANPAAPRLFHTHPRASDRYTNVQAWLSKRGTSPSTPPMPVCLVAVGAPSALARLETAPALGAADAPAADAPLPQETDACLDPNAPSLTVRDVVAAMSPLRGLAVLESVPETPEANDREALQRLAADRTAPVTIVVAVDDLTQQTMPWPDGVVYTVDVRLTALLMPSDARVPAQRLSLHGARQTTLRTQGGPTRDDVRAAAVGDALRGLEAPLAHMLATLRRTRQGD